MTYSVFKALSEEVDLFADTDVINTSKNPDTSVMLLFRKQAKNMFILNITNNHPHLIETHYKALYESLSMKFDLIQERSDEFQTKKMFTEDVRNCVASTASNRLQDISDVMEVILNNNNYASSEIADGFKTRIAKTKAKQPK